MLNELYLLCYELRGPLFCNFVIGELSNPKLFNRN